MIDDLTCRRATPADLAQVADLRWRLQTDDVADYDHDEKQRFIADFIRLSRPDNASDIAHWLAEKSGRIIAVMSVRVVKKLPKPQKLNGRWGYLTNVYTLPSFRNKGIGARLLDAVKEWAMEEQLELLLVWPSDQSYAFYEKAGFTRPPDPIVLDLEE